MSEIDKIFKGLEETCYTSLYFKDGDYTKIKPEYLFTTLVAKQFATQESEFIIKLEEPTQSFATNCVPQANSQYRFSSFKNVCRNGKIDIAVYTNKQQDGYLNEYMPLFPIEIKGVNPQKVKFTQDVKRNLEYFSIEDENTGSSILKQAYNIAVEIPRRFLYEEEKESFVNSVKKKYENWIKVFDQIASSLGLDITVETRPILDRLYKESDQINRTYNETEWDFFDDWHLYIGVVVSIKKVQF
ncbi:hypothetical protein [Salinimicrobium xinjiangense]|uniref:hypothetical protein n=1 Tax=Salinimicrobium xinjiangense TaxID=438596 RepID=UPI000422BCBE|nr:hypothetical protein [Salinimicrobium xinjiangense]